MPKKHPVKLSPKLEVELRDKLEDLLDEHDDVAEKRKRVAKALKGHLSILDDSISLVRRQLKGQELDQLTIPGTEKPEPAKDPLVAEILRIAGGIIEPAPDGDEEDEPAPGKAVPLLVWKPQGSNDVAEVAGGCYCLEPSLSPTAPAFTVFWTPEGGKSKRLGTAENVQRARELAERDWLERGADALLKNAGHGALTKADTKGPPVARRKGGRHG